MIHTNPASIVIWAKQNNSLHNCAHILWKIQWVYFAIGDVFFLDYELTDFRPEAMDLCAIFGNRILWDCIGMYDPHDDVSKWKHFPRYWPFVRGIRRSSLNSPHKGQWHGALMLSLNCTWTNGWADNRDAGDLIRYRAHYEVTLKIYAFLSQIDG